MPYDSGYRAHSFSYKINVIDNKSAIDFEF